MIQKLAYVTYALALSLGAMTLIGCGEGKASAAQGMPTMPPLSVSTYHVVARDIPVSLEYPAKVKSVQQVNVVARVSGVLEKKYFQEGSFVKAGEMLYQIYRYLSYVSKRESNTDKNSRNLFKPSVV